MTHAADHTQLTLRVFDDEAPASSPSSACVTGTTPNSRPEQLTIVRCPFCSVFLGYRGVGRPRIVCAAAACRRARRRALAASRAAAARAQRLRLLLVLAVLARSSTP